MTTANSLPSSPGSGKPPRFGFKLSAQTVATAALVSAVRRTCRQRVVDAAGIVEQNLPGPFIFVSWHNRLLFLPTCAPREMRLRTLALTSISRDGERAARYLRRFGIRSVRGSSSRGGYPALVELRRRLAESCHVFVTPDGPRGPRYSIQPGVVLLARKSGVPIVPTCLNASGYWELHGWDRTQIAKPWSRLELALGEPIPAAALHGLSIEEANARVKNALMDITRD